VNTGSGERASVYLTEYYFLEIHRRLRENG
jgi:hypothetical protein